MQLIITTISFSRPKVYNCASDNKEPYFKQCTGRNALTTNMRKSKDNSEQL